MGREHAQAAEGAGGILASLLIGPWSVPAAALNYPSRPISVSVPFPAGGANDTLARFLAEHARPILGQPIVIDNVAGAAPGHLTGISFQKETGTKFTFGAGPGMTSRDGYTFSSFCKHRFTRT